MIIFTKIALLIVGTMMVFGVHAKPQNIILELPTMNCPVCPITVTSALQKVDGVTDVEVLYQTKTAHISFDDQKTDTQMLIDATTNAGYPSSLKK